MSRLSINATIVILYPFENDVWNIHLPKTTAATMMAQSKLNEEYFRRRLSFFSKPFKSNIMRARTMRLLADARDFEGIIFDFVFHYLCIFI